MAGVTSGAPPSKGAALNPPSPPAQQQQQQQQQQNAAPSTTTPTQTQTQQAAAASPSTKAPQPQQQATKAAPATAPAAAASDTTKTTAPPAPKAAADGATAKTTPTSGAASTTTKQPSAPATGRVSSIQLASETEIVKSKSDHREYRRLQLTNGLDVLLIHDAKTTRAAAAMDVNVGYWSDPEEIPGLAHFLEHMLFLGTRKYPSEDSYSEFLSAHGGSSNAYTAQQNTNFYFDVQPESLEGALDRFAQFFVAPLFTEGATSREVNAVESENAKNLQSDTWRSFQLVQSLARRTHPFHKFGTGSSTTLGRVPHDKLRDALITFWKKHYVAPNLRLVVLGTEALDALQQRVERLFADLPVVANAKTTKTGAIAPNPFPLRDAHALVFAPDRLGSRVDFKSVKDTRDLTLMWLLPPQSALYGTKSLEFVSSMLGSEAPGSLLSSLKGRGLVTELTAGPELSTGDFELFQIDLELTEAGMREENLRLIVSLTMQYIRLVERDGVEEWRWKEMGRISSIHFALKNKEQAQDYVSDLASDLPKYKPCDLLMAEYVFRTWDPQGVKKLLSALTVDNMLMLVSAQNLSVPLTQTEKWYGTKYSIRKLEASEKSEWTEFREASSTPDEDNERWQLKLSEKNPYIPTDLTIKPPTDPTAHTKQPRIIVDVVGTKSPTNGSVRVWFKQDATFKRPRATVVCKLWSGQMYSSPRDVVLSSMYTKLVRDVLDELMYPATVAGFDYSFAADVDGLNLHLSGYSEGLKRFAGEIAKYLSMANEKGEKGFVPTESRFAVVKEGLEQGYANFVYGQPHVHASYALSLLLEEPHWHITQYMSAVRDITLDDVIAWSRGMFEDIGLECLVHGNMLEAEAKDVVTTLVAQIDFHSSAMAYRSVSGQVQRVVKVDGDYSFTTTTPNVADENSAVYTHYQVGAGDEVEDVATELLSMIMEKPAFNQLRTVEQLGYIVWSGSDMREGINGIRVIVQSPTRPATYLAERVNAFMKQLAGIVHALPDDSFATFVETLRTMKLQHSRTLSEETSRYWSEISTQQYKFHRRALEVKALATLTKEQFIAFFDRLTGGDVPNRITVQVESQRKHSVPDAPAQQQKDDSSNSGSKGYMGTEPDQTSTSPTHKGGSGEYMGGSTGGSTSVPRQQTTAPKTQTNAAAAPAPAPAPLRSSFLVQEVVVCPHDDKSAAKNAGDERCKCLKPSSDSTCHQWSVAVTTDKSTTLVRDKCLCEKKPSCPCSAPAKPQPEPESQAADGLCTKSKARQVHPLTQLNEVTISQFKDSLCLFPRQAVGQVDAAGAAAGSAVTGGAEAVPSLLPSTTSPAAPASPGASANKAAPSSTGPEQQQQQQHKEKNAVQQAAGPPSPTAK